MHLNFRSLYTTYCESSWVFWQVRNVAFHIFHVPGFVFGLWRSKGNGMLLIVCAVTCSSYDKLNGSKNSAKTINAFERYQRAIKINSEKQNLDIATKRLLKGSTEKKHYVLIKNVPLFTVTLFCKVKQHEYD